MTTEKRIWPVWSIIVITLIVVIAILIPIGGAFVMMKINQENIQEFRIACVEAKGTWVEDACIIQQ